MASSKLTVVLSPTSKVWSGMETSALALTAVESSMAVMRNCNRGLPSKMPLPVSGNAVVADTETVRSAVEGVTSAPTLMVTDSFVINCGGDGIVSSIVTARSWLKSCQRLYTSGYSPSTQTGGEVTGHINLLSVRGVHFAVESVVIIFDLSACRSVRRYSEGLLNNVEPHRHRRGRRSYGWPSQR